MNFDEWRETYSAGPLMNEAMARAAWDAAIAAEREECEKVCKKLWHIDGDFTANAFAAAIRARGQQ